MASMYLCHHLLFSSSLSQRKPPFSPSICMASQPGRVTSETSATKSAPPRRSGNYPPTVWDYNSIQRSSDTGHCPEDSEVRRIEELKADVRVLFKRVAAAGDVVGLLELVDDVQQMGLGYHFDEEVQRACDRIHADMNRVVSLEDLRSTSRLFRVLRENGYQVSQEIFKAFITNENHNTIDVDGGRHVTEGVLSLYEATFYASEGEDLLAEARIHTTKYLTEFMREKVGTVHLQDKVSYALELPLHWRMPRSHTRWLIDRYSREEHTISPAILELAKLDFNRVQKVHREELKEVTRWWTNLGLIEKLPFSRDRIVESFLWSIGFLHEPKYGYFRIAAAKLIICLTVIDDIYDLYGSMDELKMFTTAVKRWDLSAIEELPEYMKICFLSFFNLINETSYHILKDKGVDATSYLKKWCGDTSKSYMLESKWCHEGYTPTLEQYTSNALVTVCGPLILMFSYLLISEDLDEEILNSIDEFPNLISLISIISRLDNDMATLSEEIKKGDVHQSIQCCMHHDNASEEEARGRITDLITKTWGRVNTERFASAALASRPFNDVAVNFGRCHHSFYQHGDGFGLPGVEAVDCITSLLFEGVPL